MAGQPYVLTRDEFIRFAGLQAQVAAMKGVMADGLDDSRLEVRALWAAIAAFEAARTFSPCMGGTASDLFMDSRDRRAIMVWEYQTTSGTLLRAEECREFREAGDLPAPKFTVTIPADRDQPGRYHYEQLRRGGTYCD